VQNHGEFGCGSADVTRQPGTNSRVKAILRLSRISQFPDTSNRLHVAFVQIATKEQATLPPTIYLSAHQQARL
jgi:hypothetical protein